MDARQEQTPEARTEVRPFSIPHLVLDAVCLLLAFAVAYLLRFRSGIPAPLGVVPWTSYLAFYVVSLPFSAAGGNADEVRQKLVEEPAGYTFQRPLGEL